MHDIVHELTITAEPEQVYEAVATAAGLATWWSTDVTVHPPTAAAHAAAGPEGTEIEVGFDQHSVVIRLRVDTLDPPVLTHLTCIDGPEEWPGTQLAFRVEPANDGGTVVRFWHGGWAYENGALPRCSFQWAMYLDSLRQVLEGGVGSPAGA
jgi:uncharacterized protein YndB with AHSA1/START domain